MSLILPGCIVLILVLSLAGCLLGLIHSPLLRTIARSRPAWASLLVLLMAVVGGAALVVDQPANGFEPQEVESRAQTDRGRSIRLWQGPPSVTDEDPISGEASRLIRAWNLTEQVLRTAPGSDAYNCHGWTFADAQYWILDPAQVEWILEDNGYTPVAEPSVGDLAIFRDGAGGIAHSGVVRGTHAGQALIESKWGRLGRFIHGPRIPCYDMESKFYRSPRKGHRLKGV